MTAFKRQMSLQELEEFLKIHTQQSFCSDDLIQAARKQKEEFHSTSCAGIYGRICTTRRADSPPVKLSDSPGRKTAFLFGPETVYGALMEHKHDPYTMLLKLGFLPEYIYLKACIQKSSYWLVLLAPEDKSDKDGVQTSDSGSVGVSPLVQPVSATWDGLLSFLGHCYPESLPAVTTYWSLICSKPVEYFQAKSPIKFIEALSDPGGPSFMSYSKFVSLPKPQTDWETRLFLYCELRILELFSGDGYTWSDAGVKGEKEYISPNYIFQDLGSENYIVIRLNVRIPPEVAKKFAGKKCSH